MTLYIFCTGKFAFLTYRLPNSLISVVILPSFVAFASCFLLYSSASLHNADCSFSPSPTPIFPPGHNFYSFPCCAILCFCTQLLGHHLFFCRCFHCSLLCRNVVLLLTLFSLWVLSLDDLFFSDMVRYWFYADNLQICLSACGLFAAVQACFSSGIFSVSGLTACW